MTCRSQIVQLGGISKRYPRARHAYRLSQIAACERGRCPIQLLPRDGGVSASPLVLPDLQLSSVPRAGAALGKTSPSALQSRTRLIVTEIKNANGHHPRSCPLFSGSRPSFRLDVSPANPAQRELLIKVKTVAGVLPATRCLARASQAGSGHLKGGFQEIQNITFLESGYLRVVS